MLKNENKEIRTDGGSIVKNRPTERDPGGTVKLWGFDKKEKKDFKCFGSTSMLEQRGETCQV